MAITNTTLLTTANVLLIGSGNLGMATTTIYFCNRSASATTFNLYVVQNGQTTGNTNIVYSNKLVAPNDTYIADLEKIFLGIGDYLAANANVANAIVATTSYIGI
jgi:hypothetical protein